MVIPATCFRVVGMTIATFINIEVTLEVTHRNDPAMGISKLGNLLSVL